MSARTVTVADLVDYLDHFQRRVIADALAEGTSAYWLRRAEQFEASRPRPGDFVGETTVEQRREQWRRLTEMAKACRARAQVALLADGQLCTGVQGLPPPTVQRVAQSRAVA